MGGVRGSDFWTPYAKWVGIQFLLSRGISKKICRGALNLGGFGIFFLKTLANGKKFPKGGWCDPQNSFCFFFRERSMI